MSDPSDNMYLAACSNCNFQWVPTPVMPKCPTCGADPSHAVALRPTTGSLAGGDLVEPSGGPVEIGPPVLVDIVCTHCSGDLKLEIDESGVRVVEPAAKDGEANPPAAERKAGRGRGRRKAKPAEPKESEPAEV